MIRNGRAIQKLYGASVCAVLQKGTMGLKDQRPAGSPVRTSGERLYLRVKNFIRENGMILPGESVVAGVSGGADSLCLFMVLVRLSREAGFFLHVVHVHHGLRASAQEDLQFVEKLCRQKDVPFTCVYARAAETAKARGIGVEEAGRRIRYEAFERVRVSLEKERGTACRVAVAHHREDQAETVLFHLCRGTDLRGARGMLPVSGTVIRPLLQESRQEIESFLVENRMTWREDETNTDTSYTRNYLRGEILPRLAEGINPSAAQHIAGFARTCAEAERFLEAMTREAAARCAAAPADAGGRMPHALDIRALLREDPYLRGRVLFRTLAVSTGTKRDLESVHVEALRALCEGGRDGRLSMPGKVTVVRSGGTLFFLREEKAMRTDTEHSPSAVDNGTAGKRTPAPLEIPNPFPLSASRYECRLMDFDGDLAGIPRNLYTKWFDYDKIGAFPVFRQRERGDIMLLSGGTAAPGLITKKLARVMLDGRVPALFRDRIVLPFRGREALWIPGLRMGDGYRITKETKRILEIRCTEDPQRADSKGDRKEFQKGQKRDSKGTEKG